MQINFGVNKPSKEHCTSKSHSYQQLEVQNHGCHPGALKRPL